MPDTMEKLLELAPLFAEGAVSAFWAVGLCRCRPPRHPERTAALVLLYGALFTLSFWTERRLPALLALHLLLAAAVWLAARPPLLYAAAAGAMAALLTGTMGLLRAVLFPRPWEALLPAGLGALLAAVCRWRRYAVLPETENMLTVGDRAQTRKFYFSTAAAPAVLLLLDGWVWYEAALLPVLPAGGRRLALFTGAIVLAAVLLLQRLAVYAAARVEALVDKQYQTELLNFMQIIRSQRHDFNFHIQAISGMIEDGKYQECNDYIHTMVKVTTAMNDVLPVKHPAVSAMLNSFRELAAQKRIAFDVSISNDLSQIPCTIYEINTVIGNLIQNAVDEVEQNHPSRPWISVLILKRGGSHIIKVTNPCSRDPGEFKNCFQAGYTTKQSHEGIGLATVSRIVSKYHGSVFPEFDDGVVSFIVQLAGSYS